MVDQRLGISIGQLKRRLGFCGSDWFRAGIARGQMSSKLLKLTGNQGGEQLMRLPSLLALAALVGFVIVQLVLRPA